MQYEAHALLPVIVGMPLAGALVNGALGRRLGPRAVSVVGCLSAALSFVFAVLATIALAAQAGPEPHLAWTYGASWIPGGSFSIEWALYLDPLSAVMTLVVTGIGSFIHLYSVGYMHGDRSYARYFAFLNLFLFAMLLLVLGKNLLVMFIGWEGVGLCSYLLIGFWFEDDAKAKAGKKAFIVNRIGDFGFLIAVFILLYYVDWTGHGALDFGALRYSVADGASPLWSDPATITGVCLLLFLGATGKSAQIPLYIWLPDAMAGPTPVSALIHAATMVTAGVYMIARLSFLFVLSPVALCVVAGVGAATALFAATIGFAQTDIKKVLAYSTVSQLGFMFLGVGVGAFGAAIFHLMTHAFFKACLFLGAGSVIHALGGEQDIRKMGGLARKLPITRLTFLVSCLAIAGVPLLSGFFSKDEILWKAFSQVHLAASPTIALLNKVFFGMGLLAAVCTAFYMFRLYFLTFSGETRASEHAYAHAHESPWTMTVPLLVLAVGAVFSGYLGLPIPGFNLLEHWLEPALGPALIQYAGSHDHTLELLLMGASVLAAAIGIGAAWALYRGRFQAVPAQLAKRLGWLYRLVYDKYRIDELYGWLVVRPVRFVARLSYRVVDRIFIDILAVNGAAYATRTLGAAVRLFQNGNVQAYAVAVLVGMALLFLYVW